MPELHLLRGGDVLYTRPVGNAPTYIGRSPTADLVLTDTKVSGRHAVVWMAGGEMHVEDLGSKNGTFVNDQRLTGRATLGEGDLLRLGHTTVLRVVLGEIDIPNAVRPVLVEDVAAGVRYPVRSDRFLIGSGEDCDLRVPEWPERAATLVFHSSGEVWLGTDDADVELDVGTPFSVLGRKLTLREATDERTRTAVREETRYPYRLIATLEGPTGPQATLEHLAREHTYTVTSEHRATLLYLLARQVDRDRAEGVAPDDCGWIPDEDVATGVWGRQHHQLEPNNYHVLVCRLRKELKDAGFDAWFIEKKRKHTRARLTQVATEP